MLVAFYGIPEGVFYDDGGVHSHTKFEVEHVCVLVGSAEVLVAGVRLVPSLVLYEAIVNAQVGGQGAAAMRTPRNEVARHAHALLPLHHGAHGRFVVVRFLRTGAAALEQAVVALGTKQPALVEARQMKLMVHIRGYDEVVLVSHQVEQVAIGFARLRLVAIDENVSTPPRPERLGIGKGEEASRIHIGDAEAITKVSEILVGGHSCTGAYEHGIGLAQGAAKALSAYGRLGFATFGAHEAASGDVSRKEVHGRFFRPSR